MARIKLKLPEKFQFSVNIPLRIVDMNYAGHLGNDSLLSILHEARMKYLDNIGCSEFNACGSGLIMADAALVYWSETFYGDVLIVSMAAAEFTHYGFDLYYLVTTKRAEREITVAHAKTQLIFFNYGEHKKLPVPPEFRERIDRLPHKII